MSENDDWRARLAMQLQNVNGRLPGEITSKEQLQEALFEPLSISGGEEFSAEEHRGREVLELLQNARDAARDEDNPNDRVGDRAVYVQITGEGLLVANTGDSFEFDNPKVQNSLRIFGHSEKTEEEIGDFGVGLTAIRSVGESYEVWSKKDPGTPPEESPDDADWRVVCSPRNTIAAIAGHGYDSLNENAKSVYDSFIENEVLDVSSSDLKGNTEDSRLPDEFLDAEKIPYFAYPVALESWYENFKCEQADPRRRRGHQLLTGDSEHSDHAYVIPAEVQSLIDDVGTFTTAVFVDYEDDVWRTLYDALSSEEQRLSGNNHADRLRSQAWFNETTANESNSSQITPELLLNLRGIDRLVVEDNREDGPPRIQRWNVFGRKRTRDAQDTTDNALRFDSDAEFAEEAIKAWKVSVELESGGAEDQSEDRSYEFLNISFNEGRTYGDWRNRFDVESVDQEEQSTSEVPVSLLLKRTPDYGETYHPHLYYPISRSDSARQFPLCIHGDFVVQQGRQSLSGSDLQRNCIVAAEAARLVGRLSEILAEQEQWDELRVATPWCLLPDATGLASIGFDKSPNSYAAEIASQSAQEIGNNAPFDALRADIYRELRQRKCLRVKAGDEQATRRPIDDDPIPLVHSNPVVMGAIAALYSLRDTLADNSDAPCSASIHGSEQVPTRATLIAFSKWLTTGQQTENDRPFSALFERLSEENDRTWIDRVKRLESLSRGFHSDNSDDNEDSGTTDGPLFQAWATVLHDWAETLPDDVEEVISNVDWNVAHTLLEGTLALADGTRDLNDLTRDNGSNPHLLPCIPTGDDEAHDESPDTTQLVTVEGHQTEGKAAASESEFQRQVLRPDRNQAVTPPREDVQFNIFYLTQRACLDAVAEADWGTRQYAGDTDLYRTLLKDIGDRIDVVTQADIKYLATRYDDASPEKNTLKPTEGSYHDFDDLSTIVSQGSDASDVMQIRNRVRRRDITSNLLTSSDSNEARTLRFSSPHLSEWLTGGEEEDRDITSAITTVESGFETPAITDDPNAELRIDQLGLLSVSILPHVRVITSVTDQAHPSGYQWNPGEWTNWKRGIDGTPDRAKELQDLLATSGDELHEYLNAISTPPFGPGVSAGHSPKCDVKDYPSENDLLAELSNNRVRLASWVWLEPNALTEITGEVLESLLELSGSEFAESILVTGWVWMIQSMGQRTSTKQSRQC